MDNRKKIYDQVSKHADIGGYDDFNKAMDDPTRRKSFFEKTSSLVDFGGWDKFDKYVGGESQHIKAMGGTKEEPIQFPEQVITGKKEEARPLAQIPLTEEQRKIGKGIPQTESLSTYKPTDPFYEAKAVINATDTVMKGIDDIASGKVDIGLNAPLAIARSVYQGVLTGAEEYKQAIKTASSGELKDLPTAILQALNAGVTTGFSALTTVQPELQAFTVGSQIAGQAAPKAVELITSPAETLLKPETEFGKALAKTTDTVINLFEAAYGAKLGRALLIRYSSTGRIPEPVLNEAYKRAQQTKEVQDASKKQSTEPISELGVRAQLGEETRVRQLNEETAPTRQEVQSQETQIDNNLNAIQNLTERGKTPEEISKVLNVPVDEVNKTIEQNSFNEAIGLAKESLARQKEMIKPEFQQDQIIYKDNSGLLRVTDRDSFEGTKESGILPFEKPNGNIQAIVKTDGTIELPKGGQLELQNKIENLDAIKTGGVFSAGYDDSLLKDGLVKKARNGMFSITEKGLQELNKLNKENPDLTVDAITKKTIAEYKQSKLTQPIENIEQLPKEKIGQPKLESSSLGQLNAGFNPGIDKFYADDIKPTVENAKKLSNTVSGFAKDIIRKIPNAIGLGNFQPAVPMRKLLGDKAYSDVIKYVVGKPEQAQVNFDIARLQTFDNNFAELKKVFGRLSDEQLDIFNRARNAVQFKDEQFDLFNKSGEAQTEKGKQLQLQAKEDLKTLPPEFQDTKMLSALKEVSDFNYKLAEANNFKMDYLNDYFYGQYENSPVLEDFLRTKGFSSTDKFTRQKMIKSIADAEAFGLKLKDKNPIVNLERETVAIAKRGGLEQLKQNNIDSKAPYQIPAEELTQAHIDAGWTKINDSVFKDYYHDPVYAKVVNSLLEANKVTQGEISSKLRDISYAGQIIKFWGSGFHLWNMAKHALAANTGAVFNPKGVYDFSRALKTYDATNPKYQEYLELGLGHRSSIEALSETQMEKAVDRFWRGNIPGAIIRGTLGLPKAFVKWQFQDFIPTLKFNRWIDDVGIKERRLGRALTDAEKIDLGIKIQQFYGEMNEKLYGRSGTVTSGMRLLFMAPGYGEGNLRTTLSSLNVKDLISGKGMARGNLKYVLNSLLTTATLGTIGTAIATGKFPDPPKDMNEVRDLFKIKTGTKDGNGDDVYLDLMTFDKDFWAIYGNIPTGNISKMTSEFGKRISGAVAPSWKALTDLSTIFTGGTVVDYKNQPIYYTTDDLATKVGKFLMYEATNTLPISVSTFGQAQTKSDNIPLNIAQSIIGLRPTTSEQVKDFKSARSDLYSMQDEKKNKVLELNKLVRENKDEAIKQAKEFNQSQIKKLIDIGRKMGLKPGDEISQKDVDFYIIKTLNEREPQTVEESTMRVLMPSTRRRKKK